MNTKPYPLLPPGWKKVKSGLNLLAVSFVTSQILISCALLSKFEGPLPVIAFILLPISSAISLVGFIRCFATPDPLSRGYLAGCFLFLNLGAGGKILMEELTLPVPDLVKLGMKIFLILLFQGSICFFIFFLLRIARFFADEVLVWNNRFFLMVETLVAAILIGYFALEIMGKSWKLLVWNFLVWKFLEAIAVYALFIFYFWFLSLLMMTSFTITQAQVRAESNVP